MLDFSVPLRWTGFPFAEGSYPLSWLAADGTEIHSEGSTAPAEALRLRFRPSSRVVDSLAIERAMDAIMGGSRAAVELDVQIQTQWMALTTKYERFLWPDGRPMPADAEEAKAQQEAIDRLYASDIVDRFVLQRLRAQQDLFRVMAEWEVLIVEPPPGWGVLATKELPEPFRNALVAAYTFHRDAAQAESTRGKAQRSGS